MTMTVGSAYQQAYGDILSLARSKLAHEQAPISAITLAHEVYLGLRERSDLRFESRVKFLAYASRAMRSLLVDMARERLAQKRSAELLPLTVGEEVIDHGGGTPEQMLSMNQAMDRLGQIDERLLRVAEMRAVLGMELADIAQALDLSEPTIKRDWKRAKAFLYKTLEGRP